MNAHNPHRKAPTWANPGLVRRFSFLDAQGRRRWHRTELTNAVGPERARAIAGAS